MARSLESYPVIFAQAVARAIADGELVIPCQAATPPAVRQQFFGYFRALRADGQVETADALEIITPKDDPPRIILRERAQSAVSLDLSRALEAAGPLVSPEADENSLFSRLAAVSPKSEP